MTARSQWLKHLPSRWYGWTCLTLLLIFLMTLLGGLLGALLFPLAGSLLRMDLTLLEMARNGFRDGAFLAFIWAPGASFIVVVMAAYEKRRAFSGDRG